MSTPVLIAPLVLVLKSSDYCRGHQKAAVCVALNDVSFYLFTNDFRSFAYDYED